MEIIIDIPETNADRYLRKLKKEIKNMTAAFDRLTAAVEANSDKVDALITKVGEQGTSDEDITALAELIEAKNAEIDAVLNPPAPVGDGIEDEPEVPTSQPSDTSEGAVKEDEDGAKIEGQLS